MKESGLGCFREMIDLKRLIEGLRATVSLLGFRLTDIFVLKAQGWVAITDTKFYQEDRAHFESATAERGEVVHVGNKLYLCIQEVPGIYEGAIVFKFSAKKRLNDERKATLQHVIKLFLESRAQEYRANTDLMTGIANQEHLKEATMRAMRGLIDKLALDPGTASEKASEEEISGGGETLDLSHVVLDIDNFKRFNDEQGHETGDDVLRYVASILKKLKDESLPGLVDRIEVGRLGGEEFGVVLAGYSGKEASLVAEELRKAIASRKEIEAYFGSKQSGVDWARYSVVTASIGVATLDSAELKKIGTGESPPPADLLRAEEKKLREKADIGMYTAKSLGKNRVFHFDRILREGGRCVDIDQRTQLITINLGRKMGVAEGMLFVGYSEKFHGEAKVIQPGTQGKELGVWPKIPSGMIKVLKVEDDFSVCRRLYTAEYAPELEIQMLGLVREDFPLDSNSWLELYEAPKVSASILTPAVGPLNADADGGRSRQTEVPPGLLLETSVSSGEKSSSEYLLSKDTFDLKCRSIENEVRHFNLSLFQIDGFERIQIKKGLPFADTLSKRLEAILSDCLPHDAMVGKRETPEKLGVIMPGKLAEDVKKLATNVLSRFNQDTGMTLSCGIFCTDDEGKLKEDPRATHALVDRSTYDRKNSLSYAEKALEVAQFEGGNRLFLFGTSLAMTKAFFYYTNKEFAKAVEEFERVETLGISTGSFHNRFGVALNYIGEYERALRQHEFSILFLNDVVPNRNVAGTLCRLRRYCRALEFYEKAEKMLMEKKWDQVGISEVEEFPHWHWFGFGQSYFECENEKEEREMAEEVNYRKAVDKFTHAIELEEKAKYYLYRGRTYLKLGDKESASDDLRMAIHKGLSNSQLTEKEREVLK